MHRYLNLEDKFKSVILLGFSIFLFWLVESENLSIYINPKYAGLTKATAVVMLLMFLAQTFRPIRRMPSCHSHSSGKKWGYIAFAIPLLMAFLLPDSALDANMAANKRIALNNRIESVNQSNALNSGKNDATAKINTSSPGTPGSNMQTQGPMRPMADELKNTGLIKVTDENFNYVMSELYLFTDDYIGKEITILGFVDKDDSFLPNQFGLARYVITCCSADASLGGLICESSDAAGLKKDTWLTVRGTIQKGRRDGQTIPVVKVTSYTQSEKPKTSYIYP
ncbi:MAG: TIGR03943 family putative permease subunit [Bacillota bacterium]